MIAEGVDEVEGHGRTALMYCAMAEQPECLQVLLKKGALTTAQDNNGQTALHWAAITVSMFHQVLVWGAINKWEDHLTSCLSREYLIHYQHNVQALT